MTGLENIYLKSKMKTILITIAFIFILNCNSFAQKRLQATTEHQIKADSIKAQRLKESVNKKKENLKEFKAFSIAIGLVSLLWVNSVLKK